MICVLFDLDGTLTDSAEGIKKSVVYALEKKEYPYLLMIFLLYL